MLFCKYQLIRTPAEPIRTRACHALHEAARNVKPTQNRLAHTRAQQQRCEEELTEETTKQIYNASGKPKDTYVLTREHSAARE